MAITMDKVLTVSVEDYAKTMNRSPSDYHPRGVHAKRNIDSSDFKEHYTGISGESTFLKEVPSEAEAVVAYHAEVAPNEDSSPNNLTFIASGTALIPKSK